MASGSGKKAELDVITVGRSSVDLYGQQIGSRLEDVTSFAKSVGGCPSNIAIGTARLGLKSGVITRVGDEQMGRYIREQMAREGVATTGITTDPTRLTSLVLLSVENDKTFPLIFYRDNCADSALCENDIDENFVKSAKALLVTGTHFARPLNDAAQRKAMREMSGKMDGQMMEHMMEHMRSGTMASMANCPMMMRMATDAPKPTAEDHAAHH